MLGLLGHHARGSPSRPPTPPRPTAPSRRPSRSCFTGAPQAEVVVLAVEHDAVGHESLRRELVERADGGARNAAVMPSSSHSCATRGRRRSRRPAAHARGALPLGRGQHFESRTPGDARRRAPPRRPSRARPRTATDLVDPTHDVVARLPTETFDAQGRIGAGAHTRTLFLSPGCAREDCPIRWCFLIRTGLRSAVCKRARG